jgi:hypothetical protein
MPDTFAFILKKTCTIFRTRWQGSEEVIVALDFDRAFLK